MNKHRVFHRGDWLAGAAAALIAFVVYAWTTAPSVTLLDSGEFLVAAQHFGVPHPTGYPLWTMLAWLFQLIPLGNTAWQIALFSGVCGAIAVGLAAMLIRNTCLWITNDPAWTRMATVVALSASLLFAFSFSMWSQAVIVEVYALHALLVGLYLTSLYIWIRNPQRLGGFYWSFFLLALGFSNHQLVLIFAVVPLQLLIVLLLRRDLFWDLLLAAAVCALIAYLAFAMLATSALVIRAALRLAWFVGTILVLGLILKRGRLNWRLTAFLPLILIAGLLPYAYLPFASSTNPPMNWGYTRTPEGFFYSFNRSPYPGSLSELSLRALSKVLGVAGTEPVFPREDDSAEFSTLETTKRWSTFFWYQLAHSFTPLGILFFFAAFLGALRLPLSQRVWCYALIFAFVGAAFVQPVLGKARIDNSGWWLQMPYHTYTNLIFALLCGIGAMLALRFLAVKIPALRAVGWGLLLLPVWPLLVNYNEASQRDHWFGWQFGRDILAKLPRGSVIFGGTDPGRFIPTYLILGESTLPARLKIDPSFDRRDLYIITQNGLADRFYLQYIRDHYTEQRPRIRNDFEKWLGRSRNYPDDPLILPTIAEMEQIRKEAAKPLQGRTESLTSEEASSTFHGAISKWIFEKNKDKHAFYVEESFPMKWSYPYAVPDGLVYRINPSPVEKLSQADVDADFKFWTDYIAKLKADPHYPHDFDAQRSFAHLRASGGHIYAWRKMNDEARRAFLQSLELWGGCMEALVGLSNLDWELENYAEPIELFERALQQDPFNTEFARLRDRAVSRKNVEDEIAAALKQWQTAPTLDTLRELIVLYAKVGAGKKMTGIGNEGRAKLGDSPPVLALLVEAAESKEDWKWSMELSAAWTKVDPNSAEAFYRLARAQFAGGDQKASIVSLVSALKLGGVPFRERLFRDPVFASLKNEPAFERLMVAPPPDSAGPKSN